MKMLLSDLINSWDKPHAFVRLFMKSGTIFEGFFVYVKGKTDFSYYEFMDKRYGEINIDTDEVEAFQEVDNLKYLEQKAHERSSV
jgi:hypothetical protein